MRFPLKLRFSQMKKSVSAVVLLLLALLMVPMVSQGQQKGQVVLFVASWCASCQEAIPIVQEHASGAGYTVNVIDIDASYAPSQSKQFGLTDPKGELPMVFLYQQGRPTLILDGRNYQIGQTQKLKRLLQQGLP